MDVYLMQHGLAVAEEVDPDRPLSQAGREAVSAVAQHAAASGVSIDRIVHSGKTRAAQTARILADALGCSDVSQVEGLKPNDPVAETAAALIGSELNDPERRGSLAIVGHLPSLDRLASLLVAHETNAHVVAFRNAGLVKLAPSSSGTGFSVAWILTPELARG